MVNNSRFLITTAMMTLLGAAVLSATPIPITNAGFEADTLADGAFTTGTITGWVCSGACGVFNPTTASFTPDNPLSAPAGGVNVAWSNGGSISQLTGALVLPSTTYTLTVAVGNRIDTAFPTYLIEILAGSTVVASSSTPTPADNQFLNSIATFVAPASGASIGQAISVRLSAGGVQAVFDNVQLADSTQTPIPEPGTVSMMLIGFGAVIAGIRRKIRA